MFKKYIRNQRGVTLIELLAVVIILGIIAAIAAPAVISNFDDAKKNSDKQTEVIVKDAVQRYVLDQKKAGNFNGTGNNSTVTIQALIDNGYLMDVPKWSTGSSINSVTLDNRGKIISIDPARPTTF